MRKMTDMTKGPILKTIVFFALPLMLGNIFQAMYTMVDTIIVGRGLGTYGLSALGSVDWLVFLPVSALSGLTQGFSIRYAKDYGAGDIEDFNRSVCRTFVLGIIFSFAILLGVQIFGRDLLRLMNTSELVFDGTLGYLRVIGYGLPFVFLYNYFASILRSLGNSRDPLVAMVIASLINIVLDYLFVITLKMGVASAALATVIAQIVSMIYCAYVTRNVPVIEIKKEYFTLDMKDSIDLLKLGTPMMMMNVIISVGGMIVQSVVNGLGIVIIAANTVINKNYTLLETAAVSCGYAMTTYAAQNLGAGKMERIRKGYKSTLIFSVFVSLLISAMIYLFRFELVRLFVDSSAERYAEVVDATAYYYTIFAAFLPVLYILHISRNTLQGLQDTITPMMSSVMEFIMRLIAALNFTRLFGTYGIFYAEVAAWVGAASLLSSVCIYKVSKLKETV